FPVICPALCGIGQAALRTSATVMQPAALHARLNKHGPALSAPPGHAGTAVFTTNRSHPWHTLNAACATANTTPEPAKPPADAKRLPPRAGARLAPRDVDDGPLRRDRRRDHRPRPLRRGLAPGLEGLDHHHGRVGGGADRLPRRDRDLRLLGAVCVRRADRAR